MKYWNLSVTCNETEFERNIEDNNILSENDAIAENDTIGTEINLSLRLPHMSVLAKLITCGGVFDTPFK